MGREACLFCDEAEALDRHHIVPKRHGGSDSDKNLVTVCPTCHRKLERLYNQRFYEEVTDGDIRPFSTELCMFFDEIVCECAEGSDYDWVDNLSVWSGYYEDLLNTLGLRFTDERQAELLSAFYHLPQANIEFIKPDSDRAKYIEIIGPNPNAHGCDCITSEDVRAGFGGSSR